MKAEPLWPIDPRRLWTQEQVLMARIGANEFMELINGKLKAKPIDREQGK